MRSEIIGRYRDLNDIFKYIRHAPETQKLLLMLLHNPNYTIIELKNKLIQMARSDIFDKEIVSYVLKLFDETRIDSSITLLEALRIVGQVIDEKYMCPLMAEEPVFMLIFNGFTENNVLQKIDELARSNEIALLKNILKTTADCLRRIHVNYDESRLSKVSNLFGEFND